jgi:RNA polymerase sigma-70 factor (ECF subfamily)
MLRSGGPRGFIQPMPEAHPEPESEPAIHAEERVDLKKLQQAFSRLAARLAPKQRAAFVLREIEGLPTSEVARVMNVAESTIRNHLLQARRILKAGLERDYPGLVPRGRDRRE